MRNLLSANFLRLRKSVLFWGLLAVMFAFGAFFTLQHLNHYLKWGAKFYLTIDLFTYALLLGFGMAVFIPLFFGAEHSDGTFRNKLMAGHTRLSIYLSHLITSIAVAISAAAAYVLPVLAVGLFIYEPPALEPGTLILLALGTLALLAAYCALYTLVAVNFSRKSTAAVICLLGMAVLYLAAGNIEIPLMHPEYLSMEVLDSGEVIPGEPNPRYVGGAQREALETLYDILPTGQSLQYMRADAAHPERLPLYSLVVVLASTRAGVLLFRKKDLK